MRNLVGKSAVCFSGREHHLGKLAPLMDYLQQEGGLRVRYVTSAFNSYNVDSFERPLRDRAVSYDLIQDWMNEELVAEMHELNHAVQNEITSRMFLEQHNMLDYISTLWTRDAFRDTIECYVLFREYLKDIKPNIVFVLHESNFWTKILSFWAKEYKIPVVSFQEGMYRPYPDSQYFRMLYGKILTEYSSKVCLWGDYAKDIFTDCGISEHKLVTVGAPHLDELLAIPKEERQDIRAKIRSEFKINSHQKIILMLLSPSKIWQGDLVQDIRLIGEYINQQPDIMLVVKWHPMEHIGLIEQVKQTLDAKNHPRIIHEHDRNIIDLIWSSDLALTQNSTSGLECLVFGVPLVEWNLSNQPLPNSYYKDGVAERIHHAEDIPRLSKYLQGQHFEVTPGSVERYLERLLFRLDGKTQERILKVVEELTN
jgi:hypothetical protein